MEETSHCDLPGLYVDAEGDESSACLRELRAHGLALKWLSDTRAVELQLARTPHAFLLLRIEMPRLDGLSLLSQLRARGYAIPAILLSARVQAAERVRALNLGADDVLNTPLPAAELCARVRALLRRSMPPARRADGRPADEAALARVVDALRLRLRGSGATIEAVADGYVMHKDPLASATGSAMDAGWATCNRPGPAAIPDPDDGSRARPSSGNERKNS